MNKEKWNNEQKSNQNQIRLPAWPRTHRADGDAGWVRLQFSSRSDGLSRAVALQARQGCDFDLIQSCERKAEKALLVGLSHTPAHFDPPRVRTNEISTPVSSRLPASFPEPAVSSAKTVGKRY